MMLVKLWFLTILLEIARATKTVGAPLSLDEAFRVYGIVPQIIQVSPTEPLIAIYNDDIVNFGNVIPVERTLIQPYITWPNVNKNQLYTFICIAPDFTGYSTGTQSSCGIVVNIPGPDMPRGDVLITYIAPFPLPGSGYNRYIGFIYLQPSRIRVTTELVASLSTNFFNFSITEFVSRYRLGNPIAGNFFRSRLTLCNPWCGSRTRKEITNFS